MPIDPRIQKALNGPAGSGRDLRDTIKPKRGYAAPPGTGPSEETCASCRHIGGVKGNEYSSQCRIAKRGSWGVAIFISPTSPACRWWSERNA